MHRALWKRVELVALAIIAVAFCAQVSSAQAPKKVVGIELPTPSVVFARGTTALKLRIHIDSGWHLYAPGHADYMPLTVKPASDANMVVWAQVIGKAHEAELFGEKVSVYEGTVPVEVHAKPLTKLVGDEIVLALEVSYQACNDQICLMPTTETVHWKLKVVDGEGPASSTPPIANPPVEPIAGAGARTPSVSTTGDRGLLWEALLALGAGLLVTLTPCVYPVIPVTITYFQQQGGSRAKTVPLAVAYGLGIVIMYTTLGVVMAKLGQDLGSLLGNPFIAWGFVALFLTLALSMFGYYDLALPSSITTWLSTGERSGIAGALLLGLTLGLVAAPCVGPVAGGLMLYVATRGDVLFGVITFGAFGAGIALPFMALGLFTGSMRAIPRAGAWMESVKHAFGWLILAFCIYFVNVAAGSEELLLALIGLYAFFAGITAHRAGSSKLAGSGEEGSALGTSLYGGGLLGALVGIYFLFGPYVIAEGSSLIPPQALFKSPVHWQQGDHDALLAAAKQANRPVVIDFTARWCAPCQELELTTFREAAVVAELKRFDLVKVDVTSDRAAQTLKIDRYQSYSVPFIAFYDSSGSYLAERSFREKPSTEEFLARLKEIR